MMKNKDRALIILSLPYHLASAFKIRSVLGGYLNSSLLVLSSSLLLFFSGCLSPTVDNTSTAANSPIDILRSLPTVQSVEKSDISFADISYDSITIKTDHYIIHTTATDRLILRRLPMLLESAYLNFSKFAPADKQPPGVIYYFKKRDQWLTYTRHLTGSQASTLEKIHSGAYCYQDICVAWQINRAADFSVLTHEAWHQYCGINMADTLPSWLAESSAVYLESFTWDTNGLKFSPKHNLNRLWDLRRTMQAGISFSIDQITQSDPGMLLNSVPANQKELVLAAFYARLYALARFMFEYEYGIYRKSYETIYRDAVTGNLKLSEQLRSAHDQYSQTRLWSSLAGHELFQSYISDPTGIIELQFQDFCGKLASSVRKK